MQLRRVAAPAEPPKQARTPPRMNLNPSISSTSRTYPISAANGMIARLVKAESP